MQMDIADTADGLVNVTFTTASLHSIIPVRPDAESAAATART